MAISKENPSFDQNSLGGFISGTPLNYYYSCYFHQIVLKILISRHKHACTCTVYLFCISKHKFTLEVVH